MLEKYESAIETLINAGCVPDFARRAVFAAASTRTVDQIESDIAGWLAYTRRHPEQIRHPGAFTAAKLLNRRPAPYHIQEDDMTQDAPTYVVRKAENHVVPVLCAACTEIAGVMNKDLLMADLNAGRAHICSACQSLVDDELEERIANGEADDPVEAMILENERNGWTWVAEQTNLIEAMAVYYTGWPQINHPFDLANLPTRTLARLHCAMIDDDGAVTITQCDPDNLTTPCATITLQPREAQNLLSEIHYETHRLPWPRNHVVVRLSPVVSATIKRRELVLYDTTGEDLVKIRLSKVETKNLMDAYAQLMPADQPGTQPEPVPA
jgi:hypothetical protein